MTTESERLGFELDLAIDELSEWIVEDILVYFRNLEFSGKLTFDDFCQEHAITDRYWNVLVASGSTAIRRMVQSKLFEKGYKVSLVSPKTSKGKTLYNFKGRIVAKRSIWWYMMGAFTTMLLATASYQGASMYKKRSVEAVDSREKVSSIVETAGVFRVQPVTFGPQMPPPVVTASTISNANGDATTRFVYVEEPEM